MIHPDPNAEPTPSCCPRCSATHVVRGGLTHSGVPSYRCNACGRRFVARPTRGPVSDATKALVLRLMGERLALRAIARVTGLSRSWLQRFANSVYRDQGRWSPGPLEKKPADSP